MDRSLIYFTFPLCSKNIWNDFDSSLLDGIYLIPSIDSIKRFHGVCFLRKGPLKGETIVFVLSYRHEIDGFVISESNFAPLNTAFHYFIGSDLKSILGEISLYLTRD